MASQPTLPIEVNASATNAIIGAVVRYLLQTAGGILVARGFLDQPTADSIILQLGGVLLTVIPLAWGAIRAKLTHSEKVVLADAAPNSVAVVK